MIVKHGETLVEDEVWKFPQQMSATEAKEMAAAIFSDCYDLLNFVTHGDD